MAKSQPRIALSVSRDIPFNKLVLSQANVRRLKVGVGIEELAEDIALRTLLQSLTVRPVLDESGAETGMYEVPAGGRRYRALELLVKQKRLARTAPVPCIIRTGGIAEEDSLLLEGNRMVPRGRDEPSPQQLDRPPARTLVENAADDRVDIRRRCVLQLAPGQRHRQPPRAVNIECRRQHAQLAARDALASILEVAPPRRRCHHRQQHAAGDVMERGDDVALNLVRCNQR